jgi:alkylation response protein AidB-like acyl-CoA dehydrogenase
MVEAAPTPEAALKLRAGCTRLALQATQAALILSKGSGFVAPHPVQRWVRQALFFLVWSCPRPVASEVLDGLLGKIG